jgi:hypothetical protein
VDYIPLADAVADPVGNIRAVRSSLVVAVVDMMRVYFGWQPHYASSSVARR